MTSLTAVFGNGVSLTPAPDRMDAFTLGMTQTEVDWMRFVARRAEYQLSHPTHMIGHNPPHELSRSANRLHLYLTPSRVKSWGGARWPFTFPS